MKPDEKLPELSHLQFAILEVLGISQMKGKDLRAALSLSEFKIKKSGPAFYQLMARLEESKCVDGSYTQEIIDGQIIKERNYKITGSGIRALNQTKEFYRGKTRQVSFSPSFA